MPQPLCCRLAWVSCVLRHGTSPVIERERKPMKAILVMIHCPSNTGYAIATLEAAFFKMAEALVGNDHSKIHFSYSDLNAGAPKSLPESFTNVIAFDPASTQPEDGERIKGYIQANQIDVVFGFDQPVRRPMYPYLRAGGVRKFISYWGAPMSSLNTGLKLLAKRVEVCLSRSGPDHYIFESKGMQQTAVYGRGIAAHNTSVTYIGIDPDQYFPEPAKKDYVYDTIQIPRDRKVFIFTGHMEERKGVRILIEAAKYLIEHQHRRDFHLLILGNINGQEARFLQMLEGSEAAQHVTFGGYRNDIKYLLKGCYAGLIASIGWDSFTCSSLEMAASGMPLIVSDLIGLNETVENGVTGFLFPTGDAQALAGKMEHLLQNQSLRNQLGEAARDRVLKKFTTAIQLANLIETVRTVDQQ
ncbi:Glycosyl transferase, group 1 [gamma proteobacterium HdN1]|nr:Glycosyl transferase, group 1 [gamma proteobacterium HdN1]